MRNPFSLIALATLAAFAAAWTPAALAADDDAPEATALSWQENVLHFTTEFGQEELEAAYRFTNQSAHPVELVKASASCGCTVPSFDKTLYQPGESGEIKALFTLGARQGQQHKVITVETVAGPDKKPESYQLSLEVDIPVPVEMKPRVNFWRIDSEKETKTFRIVLHDQLPLKISELAPTEASSDAFDYEIETVTEGKEYLVKLTPRALSVKAREVYYLKSADDEDDVLRSFPLYAFIR